MATECDAVTPPSTGGFKKSRVWNRALPGYTNVRFEALIICIFASMKVSSHGESQFLTTVNMCIKAY